MKLALLISLVTVAFARTVKPSGTGVDDSIGRYNPQRSGQTTPVSQSQPESTAQSTDPSSLSGDGRQWELYDNSAAGCRVGKGGNTTASLSQSAVDAEANKLSSGDSSSQCKGSKAPYRCTFDGVMHLTLSVDPTRITNVSYKGKYGQSSDCKVASKYT
ncbi:hypothetical protein PYCC9005_002045 [Savitreella phatthalungensis]